jgi:hypothetical protein
MKNILRFDDEDIKMMQKQIDVEAPEPGEEEPPTQDQEQDQGSQHTIKLKVAK